MTVPGIGLIGASLFPFLIPPNLHKDIANRNGTAIQFRNAQAIETPQVMGLLRKRSFVQPHPSMSSRLNSTRGYGPRDRTTYRWALLQRAAALALSIIIGDDRRVAG